jgi:cytochrome bd ubiquinol oxidase subunit II
MVMFWVALLAISMLIYLLLDGFDLGVGMLYGLTRSEVARTTMLNTIAPVWDGNETWLIVSGVILWGAFPPAYATLMSAFYIPVIIMLLGLILRGVAFEFRGKTKRLRWIWDLSFVGGSLVASFMQGVTVGALVEGLQFTNGQYSGGIFGWLSTFSVLCGIGLCLGYALLGASWLLMKCHSEVRSSILHHDDDLPFYAVALIFTSAFGTLALSFWPYMIPFVITVDRAAAPHASLAFMFWGEGLFVFPLMLLYVAVGYRVFRGKVESTSAH